MHEPPPRRKAASAPAPPAGDRMTTRTPPAMPSRKRMPHYAHPGRRSHTTGRRTPTGSHKTLSVGL